MSVPTQGSLVTVRASGEAKVTPEIATTILGVVVEATEPSVALNMSTERMKKLIRALHDSGIEPEDVRTTGLNLMAQYTHKQGEASFLRGYQVRNSVFVTVRRLSELGSVLRAGVEAGANLVGNLSLKANNMREAHGDARKAAVEALMRKAEEYARIMGGQVKALRSLEEKPEMSQTLIGEIPRGGMTSDGMSAGTLSVRIDVEGVFELD